jgi:hypothetical protein
MRKINRYAPVAGCECEVCNWLRRRPRTYIQPGTPEWTALLKEAKAKV